MTAFLHVIVFTSIRPLGVDFLSIGPALADYSVQSTTRRFHGQWRDPVGRPILNDGLQAKGTRHQPRSEEDKAKGAPVACCYQDAPPWGYREALVNTLETTCIK